MNITACIITNNDRRVLNAIKSVQSSCNEIILVETSGQNDFQKELNNLGVKLFFKDWTKNFSEARNYSIEQATGEYILIIDSDEILNTEIKYLDSQFDYYLFRINHDTTYHWGIRIFRNIPGVRYSGKLHETVDLCLQGLKGAKAEADIIHKGYADSKELAEKTKRNYDILITDTDNPFQSFHLARHYYSVCDYRLCIEQSETAINTELSTENRAWLLNIMYDAYLKQGYEMSFGLNLLIESLKLLPNQITARALIVNYLLLTDKEKYHDAILQEIKKIESISYFKNSDLPSDNYYSQKYLNNLIKEI